MIQKLILSFLLLSFQANAAHAQSLQCEKLPALMNYFLSKHFSVNELTDDVKGRTVTLFLKFIDSNKQLLYKKDVEKLRAALPKLFENIKKGDCTYLSEVTSVLVSKAEENAKLATEILNPKFAIDATVKYQSDPKKRDYAVSTEEKKTLLNRVIHTQIATIMAAGDVKLEKAKQQLLKRYELMVKRSKEMTSSKMIDLFAESFAHSLDPHSDYLSNEQLDEFRINMNLSLEGIGVSLSSEDGYTTVQEVIAGGSADRAKALVSKDKIISVAQDKKEAVSIIDMDLSDVVKMIRGKKGTKVTLGVVRQKGTKTETFNVTLVRDKVDMKEQAARVHYEERKINGKNSKIALIDLPSFYGGSDKNARDCYADMKKIIDEANAKKVDGIILDLTNNGGGLLTDAVNIAGLFFRLGPVVATQSDKRSREILADDDPKINYSGPLMVLISRQSASASEILAGAMKDYKRALIVGGDHTYGKGSVQVLETLPLGLGAMKYTAQMFYLPGGNSTQNIGVSADVSMPSFLDVDDMGEQFMDYALPPSKTTPFISMESAQAKDGINSWTPVNEALVKDLKEKSSKRVASNQEFKDILEDLEEMKKNEGWIKVADIIQRSSKEKNKRKERKEKSTTAKGRQELWLKTPMIQESLKVMEDWLAAARAPLSKN